MAEEAKVAVKETTKEAAKPSKKVNLRYKRDRDREIVTGKFMNHENPGGTIKFVFKKHDGDKVERYTMSDGVVYKVPRGVALHVANNCWYPVNHYKQNEYGKPSQEIGMKKKRFSFMPLDFIIDDEFETARSNSIITVRNI